MKNKQWKRTLLLSLILWNRGGWVKGWMGGYEHLSSIQACEDDIKHWVKLAQFFVFIMGDYCHCWLVTEMGMDGGRSLSRLSWLLLGMVGGHCTMYTQ